MSHQYLGRYSDEFRSSIDEISDKDKQLIFSKMRQLLDSSDPRQQQGVKKLKEKRFDGAYRLRAGNYRILFEVKDQPLTHLDFEYRGEVLFIQIGNRKDIYD